MSDRDESAVEVPNSTLAKLKFSITNLWDEYGNTGSLVGDLFIQLLTAASGITIYLLFDGYVGFAGVVLAILPLLAILKWVVGL
jgi:hypothetical protein